jgi:transcriptional regulator with XRE-family HTH domain
MAKKKGRTGEASGLKAQLRQAIRDSGQSLNQLSALCGVGRDRLSRFVRGERGISMDAAEKICEVLRLRLITEGPPPGEPATKQGRRGKAD